VEICIETARPARRILQVVTTPRPQKRQVRCVSPSGLHRLAYLEWGTPNRERVLVCVHGLTRCARDFDVLAASLAADYRVICPDLPGRGDSDWLQAPDEYQLTTYLSDMVTLIARADVESVAWVGTSLGGLVGMMLAALPGSPVTKLVLNDVGPVLAASSLARIAGYLAQQPALPTFEAAEAYVRSVYAPFGPHSDAEWCQLTRHTVRELADGSFRLHHDPAISLAFTARPVDRDVDLWGVYDAIRCPTLVLRGAESDLLSRETAEQMAQRGPRARVVEIANVGHAPSLLHGDQVAVVKGFLLAGDA
jgi:pimeloyl-ACP methyl ester carboxylesterase